MEIKNWLNNGCDYNEGIALYEKSKGCNALLLKQFKRKKTQYLIGKLKHELLKLSGSVKKPKLKKATPKNIPPNQTEPISVKPATKKKSKLLMHQLPAELRPVYQEAYSLFVENCRLKVELNETPASVNTYSLQAKMEANWKRNQWCWSQIDFWNENGFLPKTEPSEFDGLNAAQLVKRQQLKWQQISKAEKYISIREAKLKENPSLKDRVKLETQIRVKKEKLLQYEAESIELKKRIDNE